MPATTSCTLSSKSCNTCSCSPALLVDSLALPYSHWCRMSFLRLGIVKQHKTPRFFLSSPQFSSVLSASDGYCHSLALCCPSVVIPILAPLLFLLTPLLFHLFSLLPPIFLNSCLWCLPPLPCTLSSKCCNTDWHLIIAETVTVSGQPAQRPTEAALPGAGGLSLPSPLF